MIDLPICLVDFETRSYLNVKHVGAWRYAEDPTTEILCLGYKFSNGKRNPIWVPGLPFPQEIIDHILAGGFFEAHNVQFERAIWKFKLKPLGIPVPVKWKDTLAVGAYRGIPLALDKAGDALHLPIQKDKRGKYLLNTLSMPKWGTKAEPDRIYREDFDLMDELYEYCLDDVDSEECLGDTLGELPPPEYGLWILDQKINQRGVRLDVEAVEAALEVTKNVEVALNGELRKITNGEVDRATQRDRMIKWFHSQNLHLDDLKKETLEALLTQDKDGGYPRLDGHSPRVIRALEIRGQLARTSTRKLEKMMMTVSEDGRVRGLLQYHGAGTTGRWSGRLIQPQNFPRALFKEDMDRLIGMIRSGDYELLDFAYGSAMDAIATSLRGMFIAAEGKVFRVCDFSAVEARVVFWVADCQAGLDVFRKSDRGESEDIYCVTASNLVGFEVRKKDHLHERQLGKITILGCGFQMGWSKLQFQAEKDYKVILEEHEAQRMVNVYREKYKEVVWLWYGLNDAAIDTVKTGKMHAYGRVAYKLVDDQAGRWLTCILPNGRSLWYYDPVIEKFEFYGKMKDSLTYMGRDNKKGGSWGRVRTYGGMVCENIVQAIARDLMAEAMIRVEKAGYPIVLTVHDEIISEVPKTFGSQEEFDQIMSEVPDWAEGCPIAVEGGSVTRYQKI